jgi:hypothetical protein
MNTFQFHHAHHLAEMLPATLIDIKPTHTPEECWALHCRLIEPHVQKHEAIRLEQEAKVTEK